MALQATTTCSARSRAIPSAVPTRPAETIPTCSRAGRKPLGSPPDDLADVNLAGVNLGRSSPENPGTRRSRAAPRSVFATTAATAAGPSASLQSGHQIGDRLAAGVLALRFAGRLGDGFPGLPAPGDLGADRGTSRIVWRASVPAARAFLERPAERGSRRRGVRPASPVAWRPRRTSGGRHGASAGRRGAGTCQAGDGEGPGRRRLHGGPRY